MKTILNLKHTFMKFIFPLLAVTAITLVISSCKKDSDTPAPDPLLTQAVLKFNGNLTDSTGITGTGTPTGTITYVNDRHGNANSAIYFDGASKVEFPSLTLKGTAFTISVWVKYGVSGVTKYFITAPGSGGPGVFQNNDNSWGFAVSVPSTSSAYTPVGDAGWHNIAGTFDGTDIKVYFDGVLSGTTNHPGTMGDGVHPLMLGFFDPVYWTGSIDDLRIYNTVLTASQIAALAAQ
jgi:hypothetical protein